MPPGAALACRPIRIAPETFHGATKVFYAPVDDFELSVTEIDDEPSLGVAANGSYWPKSRLVAVTLQLACTLASTWNEVVAVCAEAAPAAARNPKPTNARAKVFTQLSDKSN